METNDVGIIVQVSNKACSSDEVQDVDNGIETSIMLVEEKTRDGENSEEIIVPQSEPLTESCGEEKEIPLKIEDGYQFDNPFIISRGKFVESCFLKGCKWSPDGSCLLTASDDNALRIFDFPSQFYEISKCSKLNDLDVRPPSLMISEAGQIYDYTWYPFMSSWDPATSCFLTSASNCPVHLWDAFTGTLRASYRPHNYADEVTSAFSVAFSVTGDKIFAGIKDQVKIFDVSKPGRDCSSINLKEIGNQRGMMSCIVNNPVMRDLFAVGSYRKTIGLYMLNDGYTCTLVGQKNGLTQLEFSKDGSLLYSAGRRDPYVHCWDLRNPGDILFSFQRPHSTNQRIYFHLSPNEDFIVSGSTDGHVFFWDMKKLSKNNPDKQGFQPPPDFEILANNDCTNGVSLHPKQPILATASGQRHYPDLISDDEDPKIFRIDSIKEKSENSVKLWWIGPIGEQNEVQ